MSCDLCGGNENVNIYGVYPPEYSPGGAGYIKSTWVFDPDHFFATNFCDACVAAARKKNVRHAAFVFFLPTVGMMRLLKFTRCSQQEMGDLMAASIRAHDRNPLEKHILWPYGAEKYSSLEPYLTREGTEKRLHKKEEIERRRTQ
jgi:hypothetical protein